MSTSTSDAAVAQDLVLEHTRRWLERAVIGLNLCPFAPRPYAEGRVRIRVSDAQTQAQLADELCDELEALQAADPAEVETTLLVHPRLLTDFLDYNDFLDIAETCVRELGLEGELQVASFHPDYQFADAAADDPANNSNRSPYPMLHLLRESSVEQALATLTDPDAIYQRNIERLRALGAAGWADLWR